MATMTKKRADARAWWLASMDRLGISLDDSEALRRIEMTLHRWAERECNGEVEVGDDGKAWNVAIEGHFGGTLTPTRWRAANREAGALRRLAKIMARYPALRAYHQTDPRWCALYVYSKAKFEEVAQRADDMEQPCGIDCCYSSIGVAVCY